MTISFFHHFNELVLLLRNEISKEEQQSSWSKKSNVKAERVNYTTEFIVDSNFGVPGAITVTNKHQREFFLESITIEGFVSGAVHFPCKSWVQGERILRKQEDTFIEVKRFILGMTKMSN